ncbi:MAG: hypothetical protein C4331_11820 [Meiothermus sp.]
MTDLEFAQIVRRNPHNAALLERLPRLSLPQTLLVAGCLFQTLRNVKTGRPPEENISDYDVFYFDPDLSYEAEDRAIGAAAALFSDLPIRIEVRNQARVHLWFERRFGAACPPIGSSRQGVDRFLIAGTCVGIAPGSLEVYAPYGLEETEAGILRPNPNNGTPHLFAAKAESYQRRWPWLRLGV